MGTYYNFETVEAKGRLLECIPRTGYQIPTAYHRVVAVCDRGLFKQAVDVTDPEEYELFYDQYRKGYLLSFVLYDYDPFTEREETNNGN